MKGPMRDLLDRFNTEYDSGDPWGSVMGWWFKICDELYRRGAGVPLRWEYTPGAGGAPDPEEGDFCLSYYKSEDLIIFGDLLCKFAAACKRGGLDY